MAALLGCDADEIVFTSGGTEANNLAIRGVMEALKHEGYASPGKRSRLSASTWTAMAMTGSLAGFAIPQVTCPMARIAPHVFLFHLGGILLAGASGLLASRLPGWRH